MRFGKAVRTAGIALLCTVLLTSVSPRAAAAETVVLPTDCTALTPADLGKTHAGAFTEDVRSECLELPALPANTPVAVLKPASSSLTVLLTRTVAAADGRVVCSETVLAAGSCTLAGTAPFRLLLAPRAAGATGTYAVFVQPLSGDTGCAPNLPPGTVGSDTGIDVTLSAATFAQCFSLPAGGHSAQEFLTMARTAGGGGARYIVYSQSGSKACTSNALIELVTADVTTCRFTPTAAYTVLIWSQGRDATFRLARRDLAVDSLTCPAVTSTALGGPATAASISTAANVRCYSFAAAPGDRYFVALRSPSPFAKMMWVQDNGATFCSETGPCVTTALPTKRTYRVVVWAAIAGSSVPFQLDTWAVTAGSTLSPRCEPVPSIAYGLGPLTGTMTDEQSGRCLLAPVGTSDDYRVTITNADGTATPQPAAYIFSPGYQADGSFRLGPCTSSCQPTTSLPFGQTTKAVILLSPGSLYGTFPYQAQVSCLTVPCGGEPYAIAAVSPANPVAGGKATLTLTGAAFDATDTVQLGRTGSAPIVGVVRSVSADRHTLTAEVDLTGATAGAWEVTTTSALAGKATRALTVTWPKVAVTSAPSITGTVKVGVTVHATTGKWNPAATSYAYQWSANAVAIRGATGSAFLIPASLRGRRLTVTVTAKLARHTDGVSTSVAKVVAPGAAPRATKLPKITGKARVKQTVKVSVGAWSPKPDSYTYQWLLNGKKIKGGTKSTLKITKSMVGKKLSVVVVAKKAGHDDGRRSSASVKVKK